MRERWPDRMRERITGWQVEHPWWVGLLYLAVIIWIVVLAIRHL
jgi:hypothetical protein